MKDHIIYLYCGERYEDIIDHRSYAHNLGSCEIKAGNIFRPERHSNHYLCDTGAVLHQLSY